MSESKKPEAEEVKITNNILKPNATESDTLKFETLTLGPKLSDFQVYRRYKEDVVSP